jgi:hypothetical protein
MNHLYGLVNSVLAFGYFPWRGEMAVVVVLPQTTQMASVPHNYRPVSLLATTGKIVKVVILNPLKAVVNASGILPELHFWISQGTLNDPTTYSSPNRVDDQSL